MILTGGRKVCNKVFYGGDPTRGATPYTFILPFFNRKGTLFTYRVWIFASLLTTVNSLSLKSEKITKSERFLNFFSAIKCICWPFWAFLQTNDRFIKPLYTQTSEIPTLSGEPPRTGYYKEYNYGDSNGV